MSEPPPGTADTLPTREHPFRHRNTPPGTADAYALGRSDAETRRLIIQHQLYCPFSRQFLTAAASRPG